MKNLNEYKRRFNILMESTMGDVRPLLNESLDELKAVLGPQEINKAAGITLDLFKLFLKLEKCDKTQTMDLRDIVCMPTEEKLETGRIVSYPYDTGIQCLQEFINGIIDLNNNYKGVIDTSIPVIAKFLVKAAKEKREDINLNVDLGLLDILMTKVESNEIDENFINFLIELKDATIPDKKLKADGIYGPDTDEVLCELKMMIELI
jgi:hypothetical protein